MGISLISGGIVLAVVLLVKQFCAVSGWINLIIALAISACISVVAEVFLLCNKEERSKLWQIVNKTLHR